MTEDSSFESRWDVAVAAKLGPPELLLYRSNLLGSDRRITNFGGGNTSAKIDMPDPLTGNTERVLWVKGSGGDLGTMKLEGFATFYLDRLEALRARYRGLQFEDEMVEYLPHCTFNLNPRAGSIDTPLHAYIPYAHVDHMHPDAIIALAASERSAQLTVEVFEEELAWLPWQRPGFDLGLKLGDLTARTPALRGVILQGHGLLTWGDTSQSCYETTLRIIAKASAWLEKNIACPIFGGAVTASLSAVDRGSVLRRLLPELRGQLGTDMWRIGHVDDSAVVLEFACSRHLRELAAIGTSCPDHFLRTKIRPLVLDFDPSRPDIEGLISSLDPALAKYRDEYGAYYERCRRPSSPPIRDANPVVFLIPGVGLVAFARDKPTARIAAEFYVNAINVMRGATGVDRYVGLDEQEAFDIEYWALEEAKLRRAPKPRALSGRIALVTGGAGAIGFAVAERLLADGACVALADIDSGRLDTAQDELRNAYGSDVVIGINMDVTDEARVESAIGDVIRAFGGIDILVSNAGVASSAAFEDTSIDLWNRDLDVLATGYFLVSRAMYRVLLRQRLGGSIVFVASKNALVASKNAAAYCTAKAAELQLARCIALDGASSGIRVNCVNPDAVLRGSRIWSGEWLAERAKAYNLKKEELEDFYRQRSLLQRSVYPEDVAEAVLFFASERSGKSTGNILNVDAGNAAAFTR